MEIIPLSISEKFQIRNESLAIKDNNRNKPIKAFSDENLVGNSLDSIFIS